MYDYGVNKDVANLPQLRDRMSAIIDQQDVLETSLTAVNCASSPSLPRDKQDEARFSSLYRAFGSSQRQAEPRPQIKLDHPRQLAVMHALVRFANVAAGGQFTTADLYAPALEALGNTAGPRLAERQTLRTRPPL